ncbi:hypothetical protein [Pseudomonas sp. FG-3G]|nr:hypothetical protein [Pseudomonas sp. FG-3G]
MIHSCLLVFFIESQNVQGPAPTSVEMRRLGGQTCCCTA